MLRLTAAAAIIFVLVVPVNAQDRRDDCRELRQACLMKGSLGEKGEGNCRRYRERCGGGDPRSERRDRCDDLRRACLNKSRLGEEGEGNCRRYREECRR